MCFKGLTSVTSSPLSHHCTCLKTNDFRSPTGRPNLRTFGLCAYMRGLTVFIIGCISSIRAQDPHRYAVRLYFWKQFGRTKKSLLKCEMEVQLSKLNSHWSRTSLRVCLWHVVRLWKIIENAEVKVFRGVNECYVCRSSTKYTDEGKMIYHQPKDNHSEVQQ
jgi:hypothetical protein